MKYCHQCGCKMPEDAVFCSACGAQSTALQKRNTIVNKNVHMIALDNGRRIEITEYLQKCMILEKNMYIEGKLIDKLRRKIAGLGHANHYNKPQWPYHLEFSLESSDWSTFCFGAFVGGIIGLFAGAWFAGALIGGCVLSGLFMVGRAHDVSAHNQEVEAVYNQEMKRYNAAVEADKKRVQQEEAERSRLMEIVKNATEKKKEIQQTLEKFYDVNVLFPKYRNLVAVCSLYEYFIAGRYSELTGPNGAYNRYEEEIRLDRIVTKLDVIINKLDVIKANQYMLYDTLLEGNQLTQKLLDESVKQSKIAEKTAENVALSAHYSEIAANNTAACAYIGIANHIQLDQINRNVIENT